MSGFRTTRNREAVPVWQILTCLVLVGLFLYNPFLGVSKSPENFAVCHPASHRATVGSSELEQLAQPNDSATALLPKVADAQVLIPRLAATHSTERYCVEEEVVSTPQTGFSSSLWFRPPPAVS